MLLAAGAALSAIDMLSSLIPTPPSSSKSGSSKSGLPAGRTTSFSVSDSATAAAASTTGLSRGTQLSCDTLNTLLQAQSQSQTTSATTRSAALKDLFGQIDGDGDGKITKTEFENALGAGGNLKAADDVFAKMDKDGDGNISIGEMSSALKGHHRGHRHAGGGQTDPLLDALQGASSTTSSNSDGSTTTTITYADGTKVTMTPSAAQASNAASSYNFTELLIQRQAQALAASAKSSLSMNV